jgi:hypothetical protein
MTKFSRLSRYGMTYKPLMEDHGEALLTWYLEGFPAKTSPQPEKEQESQVNDQACGNTWQGLLAKYNPNTASWKTAQCSLFEDLEQSLETFPRWGSMRNGELYPRPMLELPTSETVFGFAVPTPTASDGTTGSVIGKNDQFYETATGMPRKVNQNGKDGSVGLGRLVQMWPTPSAQEPGWKHIEVVDKDGNPPTHPNQRFYDKKTGRLVQKGLVQIATMWPTPDAYCGARGTQEIWTPKRKSGHQAQYSINQAVMDAAKIKWPTPQANDNRDRGSAGSGAVQRRIEKGKQVMLSQSVDQNSGQLNPTWVEWLMGWPLGWTDLKPSGTDKCLYAPQPHGEC